MGQVARRIVFSGRVQGVGFRFTAHGAANRYQLVGFVRNLMDGTVEMIAQGNPEDIDDCIRDIEEKYAGTLGQIKIEDITFDPSYTDFRITF